MNLKSDKANSGHYGSILDERFHLSEDARHLGLQMEGLACEYLKEQGYKIKCRNFLSRYGEIDVIGYDGDILAFVEVRYRRRGSLVSPSESIDRQKVRKIKLAIRDFLSRNEPCVGKCAGIRVDLCSVTGSPANTSAGKPETQALEFQLIKGILDF